ncbi:cytoplasmic fragile-X interacting family-domain-containing protein [Chytridium lagenaria]|nr:cytoplasmic fragile-X interacting family-domain-containing protein [Chytridium lagenaria]
MVDALTEQISKYLQALSAVKIDDVFLDAAVTNPAVACGSGGASALSDINLVDAGLFDPVRYDGDVDKGMPFSFFVKEATLISRMRDLVHIGRGLLSRLYSYRSSSRAIPQGAAQDPQKRQELQIQIYELLRPEVEKMMDFMSFRDAAVVLITDVFCEMEAELKAFDGTPSSKFLRQLADAMDMCVVMDAMKNIKGSMNNDFSLFKSLPKDYVIEDQTTQYHRLYLFLGQQDQFATELKRSLQENCKHADEILMSFLSYAIDAVDSKNFSLPTSRHTFIRSIAFSLYLIDDMGEERDIHKRKKLKLDKFGKLFKAMPVVPLLGDMPLLVSNVFGKAPHLNSGKWDAATETEAGKEMLRKSFCLVEQIDDLRDRFSFSAMIDNTPSKRGEMSPLEPEIYKCILESLSFLSLLTRSILEQSAWKFWNPTNRTLNPNIPETASAYELVVKYNYTDAEKSALIEVTCFFGRRTLQMIASHTKKTVMGFLGSNVAEYLSYTSKKKEKWIIEGKTQTEPSDAGRTSTSSSRFSTFSNSQLHFICVLLEEKELKDAYVDEISVFLETVGKTVAECSDLSSLWFKEFYLELSRQVQFPISMSLPWILTEHILKSHDPAVIRCLFYPFELYNDAGIFALTSLKSQYIYDEITAEVNLCFDQLVFKIGERIFSHFKRLASHSVFQGGTLYEPPLDLYNFVTSQKNLNSLDVAIGRFEGSEISCIMELECLIKSLRKAHELLSQRLELDCFDDIFAEVNESLGLTQKHGRILTHVCSEIINDVVPTFVTRVETNRFVRSSLSFIEPMARSGFAKAPAMYLYGSKSLSMAFIAQNSVYRRFPILRICGYQSLPIISGEISKHINMLIVHTMTAYINVIQKGTPQSLRLPLFEYGTEVTYRDLQGEVLQAFREVGNAILTMRSFDEALKMHLMMAKIQLGPLPKLRNWEEKAATDFTQSYNLSATLIKDFLTQLSLSLEKAETEKSNLQIFGDGLCWGGGTFVSLLGQVGLFSAFDFNQHVVSVFRSDKRYGSAGTGSQSDISDSAGSLSGSASTLTGGSANSLASSNLRPDISSFLEDAVVIQTLYDEIFGYLSSVAS